MDPAITAIIASILGGLASLAAYGLSVVKKRKQQVELESARDRVQKALAFYRFSLDVGPIRGTRTFPEPPTDDLVRQIEDQAAQRLSADPAKTVEVVRDEITSELGEVRERIKRIEDRFPDESEIEKNSLINDALLAERIDQLVKRLDALETRVLSKWDVAKVVSGILAGISAVVAATYSVITFLGPGSG